MWNGLDLETSSFIFFGGNVHVVQIFFLHQLIVQHTFNLHTTYITLHYTLVIINIMCINIAVVHPHNKHDSEHHMHQDCNSLTTQQVGHQTTTCGSTLQWCSH